MLSNVMYLEAAAGTVGGLPSWVLTVVYAVVIIALLYFAMYRPQKKQKQQQQDLMNSMAIGDSVLTTAGFYGVIIDVMEEVVVVEFGNNKNCRIPMKKSAIVEIEKPGQEENA